VLITLAKIKIQIVFNWLTDSWDVLNEYVKYTMRLIVELSNIYVILETSHLENTSNFT
jgi:hypothetical protein